MYHVIAGCGQGVSESCTKYATESWSGGGIALLAVIVLAVVAIIGLARKRKRS